MDSALLSMSKQQAARVKNSATGAEHAPAVLNSGVAALRALLSVAATDAQARFHRKRTHFSIQFGAVQSHSAWRGLTRLRRRAVALQSHN